MATYGLDTPDCVRCPVPRPNAEMGAAEEKRHGAAGRPGAQWVVFEDSRPSERTRRLAMAALVERLERRLVATLEALDAVAALGGKLPGGYEP